MDYFTGDGDKKQETTNTTVTPPKTTKKKKSNGSYSRAKKNDPNLNSYIAGRKKPKRGVFSDKVRSQKTVKVTKGAAGSDLADKKTRIKTKYTKSGDVKSNKRVTKQDGMRTVTKTNKKGKTTTKTRKTLNPFD